MNPRPDGTAGSLQLLLLLVLLIPAIIFLISQQNALKAVRAENRTMHPGLVWLQLIPLFGNIWQFFVVTRIAGSFQKELAFRHNDSIFGTDALVAEGVGNRPTQRIGVAYCILTTVWVVFVFMSPIAFAMFRIADGLAMTVCWIIYWVQLAQFKNKLKRLPA